jgi:hypothetical protein
MANAADQVLYKTRGPRGGAWVPRLGTSLVAIALAGLGTYGMSNASDARAQGTKRLASPPTGLPWDGCSDVEGFVADEVGKYTVQSARCNGSIQAWLIGRVEGGAGDADRPLVMNQMTVRALHPGETFSAGPYCTVHGQEVRWVAIYNWKQRQRINGRSGGIVEAWTANLLAGRLEPAPRSLIQAAVCTANPSE